MSTIIKVSLLGFILGFSVPVLHAVETTPVRQPSDNQTELTEGEVKKVSKDSGKITIRHGEIKNLDMPPMTMVFRVADTALLDRLRVGDKIKFTAAKIGGAYTITYAETTP